MSSYFEMNHNQLKEAYDKVLKEYEDFKLLSLKLDMSRGKPSPEQLDLSNGLLNVINSESDFNSDSGIDCRNYGTLEGIPEIKKIIAPLMGVDEDDIMIGGNSSLNMMFDAVSCFMTHGTPKLGPWIKQGKVKFLCPSPGYDRHFAISNYFDMELIPIKMTNNGPDMNQVEEIVSSDKMVKGIWCVPKYSNPQGVTYSDDTVKRLASLKPLAEDFRIFWDNAYCIHDLTDDGDKLLNIMDECKNSGSEWLPIIFFSTSKITFPGAGISAMACRDINREIFKKRYGVQIISYDKINQLRHAKFFKTASGIINHMKKHARILNPKFDIIINALKSEFSQNTIVKWEEPKGGYFVSVDVTNGCAKRVVELCKSAGVIMTGAGATYPLGNDLYDSNIRIAPSYPSQKELKKAMNLFCICVKLAALEKMIY